MGSILKVNIDKNVKTKNIVIDRRKSMESTLNAIDIGSKL